MDDNGMQKYFIGVLMTSSSSRTALQHVVDVILRTQNIHQGVGLITDCCCG
jgi:hypothetical protein